ncbi:MAG: NAD(P)/FAD-dependent oxidoreductase, partial [Bacteroidia bacterium]
MVKHLKLTITPKDAFDDESRHNLIKRKLKLNQTDEIIEKPVKRSIDARSKNIKVHYETFVYVNEKPKTVYEFNYEYKNVANQAEVVIIGAGPAGLFAALRLIELGLKPIIIERGKDVRARRRDLAAINKEHIVNPDSNYCFGEGGAGTYSDGKLYTRSKKRGTVRRILEILEKHGSPEDILVDAHPHIGTNKLPKVVSALRETILNYGGEIIFETRVDDFVIENKKIKGLKLNNGSTLKTNHVILATGHSARDIYYNLHNSGVLIEAKPFAMGVRIEHPQQVIDSMQYHCDNRGEYLPAASYSIVNQTFIDKKKRGVFSFCMCPGGFIVPAATAPGELVVNGMSPSKRNSKFANSGIVVAIELDDLKPFKDKGALAGLQLQMQLEQRAWALAGKTQAAPAQRLVDFVEGKHSNQLNETSYIPGLASVDLMEVLGENLGNRLRDAFRAFGKKMKPYYTNQANLVGV